MRDTTDIRDKMLKIWKGFDAGKVSAQEARVHIGFARTMVDTIKVEIAAAHLTTPHIPPVGLQRRNLKLIDQKRAGRAA